MYRGSQVRGKIIRGPWCLKWLCWKWCRAFADGEGLLGRFSGGKIGLDEIDIEELMKLMLMVEMSLHRVGRSPSYTSSCPLPLSWSRPNLASRVESNKGTHREHLHWATHFNGTKEASAKKVSHRFLSKREALCTIGGPTAIDAGTDIAQWSADRESQLALCHESPTTLAPLHRQNGF